MENPMETPMETPMEPSAGTPMNCLTLYLHPAEEYVVIDGLRTSPEVSGFTITRCEGHSTRVSTETGASALDQVVGFVPRMRVEIILRSDAVDRVLGRIQAGLGPESKGHFAVTPVLRSGSLPERKN